MDSNVVTYFFQFVIWGLAIFCLWILNRKPLKTATEDSKELKELGTFGIIQLVYMSFSKMDVIEGKKESLYQKLYSKFVSSSSLYSKKPFLWKIFGKPIMLFVMDYNSIYEMQKSDAFNDRATESLLELYSRGKPGGIMMNNGKDWMETKRYTMKKLGQLGLGKKDMMTSLLAEQLPGLLDRIEYLKKTSNNKIQVKDLFSAAVVNVILIVTGGKKIDEDDPEFIEMCEAAVQITNYHLWKMFFLIYFSKFRGLRELVGYTSAINNVDTIKRSLGKFIDERESLGIYKENPEVFIDYFLQETERQKDNDALKDVYCKSQLVTLLQDLIIGGMDTTSKFLESFLMFMCLYPHIQAKVQKEIDSVMGTSALPLYYECKTRMPYTVATIYEVHRLANVIAIAPRLTSQDTKLGEHSLKKGTIIFPMTFSLRFDDMFWKEPKEFHPERFLDDNGKIIQEKVDRMLFFGTGGRVCPGENIAPAVAFTYGVGFLQKYSVRKTDDSEALGFMDDFGAINGPLPFHISIFER